MRPDYDGWECITDQSATTEAVRNGLGRLDSGTWFIEPGAPWESGYLESFNGKLQDACLNEHWFIHLSNAQRNIETWRIHYNTGKLGDRESGLAGLSYRLSFGVAHSSADTSPGILQQHYGTLCRIIFLASLLSAHVPHA
jgi:hypothetical protein